MGVHYKRWVALLEQGLLEQEFEQMSFNNKEIMVLQKVGVIKECASPLANWFE